MNYVDEFSTPLGLFSIAVNADGALVATAFGDLDALRRRIAAGPASPAALQPDRVRTSTARMQIEEYFAGQRREFQLAQAPAGSAFQRRVWRELTAIPFGTTRSYGDVARIVGSAPRAVGRANATNPVCLVVPCHRVIGADGSMTGFAFGEKIKARLLAFEGARFGVAA
jgi:methylated-DNA-[protein]-cysteine S-methyltransferase